MNENNENIECVHIPIKIDNEKNEQINVENNAPDQISHRKPRRPRIEKTGRRGKPRKIYNTGQTANINEAQEE